MGERTNHLTVVGLFINVQKTIEGGSEASEGFQISESLESQCDCAHSLTWKVC